ncbi:type II CRISPR RNA-guided endonuclease Cas9 [Diaphorobacter aerolatus]|uniref:CRISPR-associated endonuclease Cas9 n=1 Tax=Diaphorobacter aerolatus TaxID=1288495 RepID=A0A7H0GG16_9BURK|nr:type II CRISPR RNA-guided endonuclease Cas9 [Diaphorobacter aerolatus]QNP47232.1 type II CRISPR RNA-guided endonuclease Cas9 [Diaphorobacter aerolatus]
MSYRLALDLGSTSLGWAAIRLNQQAEPTALIRAGVRIFSDGRNPKDGSSLAVTRRAARAMRRRRDRMLKRKERMVRKLVEYGFFPADIAERKKLEVLNPYELRAKGLNEALAPAEFGRVLFHLNQRRGFLSNRKTDKKDNDSGALKQAINTMRTQLLETGCRTVGEWYWKVRMQENSGGVKGHGVRARYRETPMVGEEGKKRIDKRYDLYVERAMVAQEFDTLWDAQAALNPSQFNETARADLRDTLLFQRNLRPVKPGRCTLIPEEERALLALPSTQRFRIYQEVNNLRVLHPDLHEESLTLAQRDQIAAMLESKAKVTFEQMRKALNLSGATQFNLEDPKRQELKGNATTAILGKKDLFGAQWAQFDSQLQDEIVFNLMTEESEERLIAWLQANTGVDEMRAAAIANTSLPEGYGSLSRKALSAILPVLQSAVLTYDKAVRAAGFSHHSDLGFDFEYASEDVEQIGERIIASSGEIKPVYAFKQLPYYGRALQRHVAFGSGEPDHTEEKRFGKIANPTVHIGLNQVRVVVNALIRRYGRPSEIVVELARDLKQSREQKMETQRKQADNQKRNARIRTMIAETRNISEERVRVADIQKWILWEELSFDAADRCCPYSGVQISAALLLSERVEIEHILPFSKTLDDSLNNRTVVMREANRIKRNRTPWQAREDFEAQGWSYDGILLRAERMSKYKRYRFAADGYERWLGEDKDFLARALNDTRYLSRIAAEYLRLIAPGSATRVIPGQMTAMLRAKFGLNDVLGLNGEKNRNDHRHHAVDACVIGVTDQGLLQRFARASSDAREGGLTRLVDDMPMPWPTYREHVERAVNAIWVSHKPDHGHEGAMMEETSYGIGRDGSIKQRKKADGTAGREVSTLVRISEPSQPQRHGVDAQGAPLPYKGYVGGSNYCVEITVGESGKWEGKVISTFEAYAIVAEWMRKGSNAAEAQRKLRQSDVGLNGRPLALRLMIGDCVRLEHEGQERTLRVATISAAGQVYMSPLNEANVDARNRSRELPYISKMVGSFQKARARRVTLSPIGELRDSGGKE